jgi:hypothetical protein
VKRFELKYRRELFRAPEFVPYDVPGDFQRKSQRKSHIRFKRRKLAGNRVDSRSSVKGGLRWVIAQCAICLGSNKTYCAGIIVVGAAPVNVLVLTGFPQNLFGCASDSGWLAPIGGEVGGRNVLEVRSGAFFKNNLLKVDKRLLIE